MKVGLDATYTLDRNPSGVAAYSRRLIRSLREVDPSLELTLGYRFNRFLRAPRADRFLLEEFTAGLLSRRIDLFHGLNQRLPRRRFGRAVVTFHDLFVLSGEYSTVDFRERFARMAREAAERADRIIAVSAFTADQAANLLGFPRERIAVVRHGVEPVAVFSDAELTAFRREHRLGAPFLLHIGAVQQRKNIARLVEAFEALPGEVELVLAGADGYGAAAIHERIDHGPARSRVRRLGYVDEQTRAKLYRSAAALAFPSLDEGFGLPILEAFSAGLPVLTSDRAAMPEVAGQAAVLVDPFEVDEISAGLARILEDQDLRRDLIERGLRRAVEFTWRRAAEQTLSVYDQLAAG